MSEVYLFKVLFSLPFDDVCKVKTNSARPTDFTGGDTTEKFIKYVPSEQTKKYADMPSSRIIRMSAMPVDPLEPPKFKYRNMPRGLYTHIYYITLFHAIVVDRTATAICPCHAFAA